MSENPGSYERREKRSPPPPPVPPPLEYKAIFTAGPWKALFVATIIGAIMVLSLFMLRGVPHAPPQFIPAQAVKTNVADEYQMMQVTRVIDGDTIEVSAPGSSSARLRLRRYNAPEMHEPGGREAKARLEGLCLGRKVGFEVFAESYDRLVAEVFLKDGRELGAEMKRLARAEEGVKE